MGDRMPRFKKLATFGSEERGFTLVEIMLVVILLTVVAALAIPSFSHSYKNIQLHNMATNLSYAMRYAQSLAISKGKTVQLVFDDQRQNYWLRQESGEFDDVENFNPQDFERIPGRMGRTQKISEELTVDLPESQINFFPDGTIGQTDIQICPVSCRSSEANCLEKCLTVSTKIQAGRIYVYAKDG